jgi:chorismate synthase
MLRFLTAGESHGRALVVILDGVPAGLDLDLDRVTRDLRRRQAGYGRGRRMAIESDTADVLAGVRHGRTTGAPVALSIENRDWPNWASTMSVGVARRAEATGVDRPPLTRPRPGHADLAGALKYDHHDLRNVLERASARETAARVAAGSIARQLLARVGAQVVSHVFAIGSVQIGRPHDVSFDDATAVPDDSLLRCVDPAVERLMVAEIDRLREAGDTAGGAFEVIARGVPAGLGTYAEWDRRLDGRLAQAVMSIPAIKAVGIGLGDATSRTPGSACHDEILTGPSNQAHTAYGEYFHRPTNHAGGLEGGVTNGEEVRVTAHMKPIPTLMHPLRSVNLETLRDAPATIERSDVCAVPAAAVVGEAMVAWVLADALLERFGGDTVDALTRNHQTWVDQLRARLEDARKDDRS